MIRLKAVIFDIGPRTGWERRWAARLRLETEELVARLEPVSSEGEIGAITLAEVERETMRLLGLDQPTLRWRAGARAGGVRVRGHVRCGGVLARGTGEEAGPSGV